MILKPVRPGDTLSLSDRDASKPPTLRDRDGVKEALKKEVDDLGDLQDKLIADKRHAVLVILQGRDASGKDGTIKQVFDGCNPQGILVSFGDESTSGATGYELWRSGRATNPWHPQFWTRLGSITPDVPRPNQQLYDNSPLHEHDQRRPPPGGRRSSSRRTQVQTTCQHH